MDGFWGLVARAERLGLVNKLSIVLGLVSVVNVSIDLGLNIVINRWVICLGISTRDVVIGAQVNLSSRLRST